MRTGLVFYFRDGYVKEMVPRPTNLSLSFTFCEAIHLTSQLDMVKCLTLNTS